MTRTAAMAAVAAAVMVACAATIGCAPHVDGARARTGAGHNVASATQCERALAELDARIAECAADTAFVAATLVEARSLRSEALDSYVTADYDLAMELVDEALALLRNPS